MVLCQENRHMKRRTYYRTSFGGLLIGEGLVNNPFPDQEERNYSIAIFHSKNDGCFAADTTSPMPSETYHRSLVE
jgi:hypothetical protein